LFTNTGQLVLRILLISVLLSSLGVVAIPAAFAISSTVETLTLATVLFLKLRSKLQSQPRSSNVVIER
jgi:putative peptidoglycan lipid II flippase